MNIPRYRLELDIDEERLSFRGSCVIDVREAPGEIRLHAHDLEIEEALVDGRSVAPVLHPDREELELPEVSAGDHTLAFRFRGRVLEKGLIGLYRSAIPGGAVVGSMLYPNGARRVFPCFDEPIYKSVFEVTIVASAGSEVLFNTPVERSETFGDRRRVTFLPTPKMSTYLVFVAVGRFGYLRGPEGGVRISVASPPGKESSGQFALEHAARALRGFDRYYGIPYPLSKLDLVSLTDFWAGAMENWGAIAFHETRLLVDETTGVRSRRRVRETVTHEIAHQWFGNLVTMVWWNDFWLNESFAMFMQAKLDGELYPELDTWTEFLISAPVGLRLAFSGDALRSTHPIEVGVHGPAELGQLADEITYGKGAGILRMIEGFVGEAAFRNGINGYLRRFAYANARSEDLWNALAEASREPVGKIMSDWVRREGHPVVDVHWEAGALRFRQRRYLLDGESVPGVWPVPLVYRLAGATHRHLLDGESLSVPAPSADGLLVNPGRTGFYRVRYAPELLRAQIAGYDRLPEVDRWGLLHDTFSFLFSGETDLEVYLDLLRAAGRSVGVLTAEEVLAELGELDPFLPRLPTLKAAQRRFLKEAHEAIGPGSRPDEPEQRAALRTGLLAARVLVDDDVARTLAPGFSELDRLNAELRVPTIRAYARIQGEGAFEPLRDRMFAAGSEGEARQMMGGLVALEGPVIERVLGLVLDPRMPASRSWTLANGLVLSPTSGDRVWPWLEEHLPEVDRLLSGTPLLMRTLELAIPALGPARPERVRAYFADHPYPEASRGIAKGLERMEIYRRFLDRVGATAVGR
jgi:tricorn protease interacting factor F2/3